MALNVSQKSPVRASGKQFVEFLVASGRLKPGFRSILGGRDLSQIDQYLITKNLVGKEDLPKLYADYYGLPFINLESKVVSPSVANLIPQDVARKFQVIAYDLIGKDIYIAIGRPAMLQQSAPGALLRLRQQKGMDIHLAVAPAGQVASAIDRYYRSETPPPPPPPQTKTPPVATPPPMPANPHPRPLNKKGVLKEAGEEGKTVDLTGLKVPHDVIVKIPYEVAKKYGIVVFGTNLHRGQYEPPLVQIGAVNPDDTRVKEILAYIEQKNKVLVDRYRITAESHAAALKQYPPKGSATASVLKSPQAAPAAAPAVKSPAPPPPQPLASFDTKKQKDVEPPAVDTPVAPTLKSTEAAGLILSESDIINKPSNEDIKAEYLAVMNTGKIEDQDLDKLIKKPITSPAELAEVIKNGVVPEIISALLFLAIKMKASDVHIEAQRKNVRFRYRIDGILHDVISAPLFLHAPLVSRIKILSKMKIDEQRVPQDGRFDVIIDKRQVDLRISTLPTVFGEKIVMRLLDKSLSVMSLEQLGVTESNFDTLIANISKPYGIILSTGPTGSGKTTTLYAILNRVSKPGINIITLEDPVEYELPGINQSQVKPQIGFTFAEGLRSVLRQDPNVIMVGEIRDLETAAMATHAALTGHLVLSTLHTNDASGALPRLINMGVEPFLITSSINAVIGQRLVRKICDECREQAEIPPAIKEFIKQELSQIPSGQLKELNLEQLIFYKGKGCPNCTNGYRGRIGIFEVLAMTEDIEELAVRKEPASEIKKAAVKNGMITMVQDGLVKALKGITTVDEVMRVTTSSIKNAPQAE